MSDAQTLDPVPLCATCATVAAVVRHTGEWRRCDCGVVFAPRALDTGDNLSRAAKAVRDEGERTIADVVLRPEDFAALAQRFAAVAEGRGTLVNVAVGEVSLVLHRAGGDAS